MWPPKRLGWPDADLCGGREANRSGIRPTPRAVVLPRCGDVVIADWDWGQDGEMKGFAGARSLDTAAGGGDRFARWAGFMC